MLPKPNDEAFYKGRECTVKETNFLGAIVIFDDGSGREFIPANRFEKDLMLIGKDLPKQIANKLTEAKPYIPYRVAKRNRHRELFGQQHTKRKEASMNKQLADQVLSAISQSPITDIKDWRKFLEDATSKLETRTTETVSHQQKLIEEIMGSQEKPKSDKTIAKGFARILQKEVADAANAVFTGKTKVTIDDVYEFLKSTCNFTGSKSRIGHHMKALVDNGVLLSEKSDLNNMFSPNIYWKNNG